MSWKSTLGAKLMGAVGALLLVILGITFSSFYSLDRIGSELTLSTGSTATRLALAGNLKATANIMRTGQRGILLVSLQGDAKGKEKQRQDYKKYFQSERELIARIRPLLVGERSRTLTNALEAQVDLHAACFQKIVELCAADKIKDASSLYRDKGAAAGAAMEKAASELMDMETELMKVSSATGARKLNEAKWAAIVMDGLGLIVVAWMILLVRRITRTLRAIAAELGDGASQIQAATAQVAATSHSLAEEASKQAASLEKTSASSQEVTSMTRRNTENFRAASQVMETVDSRVSEGNATLGQMVSSMQEITSSSAKISRIIKVIDTIAFQTNILALNAAVEAARAGEAGLGFAVVADEVRNLAHRSAQAARDTAELIEDSIAKSNEGGVRLEQVAEVMRSITESAAKVKALVDEVSVGSREQANGMEEINRAIVQMERVTQRAAANAEENAAAGEEMAAQTITLRQIAKDLQSMVGA